MTNQEAYDRVCAHLQKQGCQSVALYGSINRCVYHTPDGLRCAIGALIPKELYEPSMEGLAVNVLPPSFASVEELFHGVSLELLSGLQWVHDLASSWNMFGLTDTGRNHLHFIAIQHNLTPFNFNKTSQEVTL